MSFAGRWVLQGTEGDSNGFLAKSGTDTGKLKPGVMDAFQATGAGGFEVEYIISGDTITRKTYFKNEMRKEVSSKLGEEVDAETFDGRPSKVVTTVVGDGLKRVEKIGGIERVGSFKANGNAGVAEMSCGGVNITRRFTKA